MLLAILPPYISTTKLDPLACHIDCKHKLLSTLIVYFYFFSFYNTLSINLHFLINRRSILFELSNLRSYFTKNLLFSSLNSKRKVIIFILIQYIFIYLSNNKFPSILAFTWQIIMCKNNFKNSLKNANYSYLSL